MSSPSASRPTRHRTLPLRASAALAAGKAARMAARLRGGGSALPGLVAEKVDPALLTSVLGELPGGVVVVSGTNGKTTTTKMLVAILRAHGLRVITNPTGSNFTRGVISSLLPEAKLRRGIDADIAVLELDEAHALHFTKVVAPTHALLLNVARDQLDRFAEIDHTAGLLAQLAEAVTSGLVLNHDDSFINRIYPLVKDRLEVAWFGLDASIAERLGELQEEDVRFGDSIELPALADGDGYLSLDDATTMRVTFGEQAATLGPLSLKQRGLAAQINATAAATCARQLLGDRFSLPATTQALVTVAPPFGRGEVIDVDGVPLELVLVKNPAGFTVALGTYRESAVASMIAINDDYADGRDVSWLYDVDFASLRERGVAMTSGIRAYDMALRLSYDEVAVDEVEINLATALDRFLAAHRGQPMRIYCTYTAMLALRSDLARRFDIPEMGQDAQEVSA